MVPTSRARDSWKGPPLAPPRCHRNTAAPARPEAPELSALPVCQPAQLRWRTRLWAAQLRDHPQDDAATSRPPEMKSPRAKRLSSPAPTKGGGSEAQSLGLAICSPFRLPRPRPLGEALSVPQAAGAPTRRQRGRGTRGSGLRSEAGSAPSAAGGDPDGARTATQSPARRWRLQPRTCPHTSRRGHVCAAPPPRPGFSSLGTRLSLPPRGDTCERGARPAPLGAEHGLPHWGGSGSEHPPAPAPQELPCAGRRHLPRPPWRLPPPQPGYAPVGAGKGAAPRALTARSAASAAALASPPCRAPGCT